MKRSANKTLVMIYCLLMSSWCSATQHVILIGIADYPNIKRLEGPLHDVALVKSTLMDKWQIGESNIVTLTNQSATKKNILAAIAGVGARSRRGDSVLIYFSGHGTSAADPSFSATLPTKTGALIPYDIEGIKNAQQLTDRLIIGRRDIRPLLTQMDQEGVSVLVIVDACYSGNVIRDKISVGELPTKFVRFSDLLPPSERITKLARRLRRSAENTFPYNSVFSLSAAHEFEAAQDIPASKLSRYPTIDGKPHGAFTDSMVRILLSRPSNDSHRPFTLEELFQSTKQLMQERRFSSTPKLLPEATVDRPNPALHTVFMSSDGIKE